VPALQIRRGARMQRQHFLHSVNTLPGFNHTTRGAYPFRALMCGNKVSTLRRSISEWLMTRCGPRLGLRPRAPAVGSKICVRSITWIACRPCLVPYIGCGFARSTEKKSSCMWHSLREPGEQKPAGKGDGFKSAKYSR